MNNQSNSLSETMVSVQISLSRLDSIANSVNLSQREAVDTFADWAEAGTSLARHFHLDNPKTLITRIKELELSLIHI